jgi:hypothetical protein
MPTARPCDGQVTEQREALGLREDGEDLLAAVLAQRQATECLKLEHQPT